MAPMAATLADDAAIDNVIAYIATLPETDAPATISGDTERGAEIFATCVSCHGPGGQGIWSMNAPRLAGSDDWYLMRQLQNYKSGARGTHPADLYGKQMNLMTGVLRDEQAMRDSTVPERSASNDLEPERFDIGNHIDPGADERS